MVDEVGLLLLHLYRYNSVCFLKQATSLRLPERLNKMRISGCFENTRLLTQTKARSLNETEAHPLVVWMRELITHSYHFTEKVKLLRSPYLRLFMLALSQIKWKISKKKAGHAYIPANWGKKFHESDKIKQREDRHYQMKSCKELFPCVPFCLLPC